MAQDVESTSTNKVDDQQSRSSNPSGTAPPGWYPDPQTAGALRWWDGGHWSDATTWTVQPGVLTPLATVPKRRRWPWFLAGGLVLLWVVGFALIAVIGVDETYTSDLTGGRGKFPETTTENAARSRESDGFHLQINEQGGWAQSGLWIAESHTDLGVEVAATQIASAAGSGFGPWCWGESGDGYGLTVYADGSVALVEQVGDQFTELARTTGTPWQDATQRHLWLRCSLMPGSPSIQLTGYVDGRKAIAAATTSNIGAVSATGFSGYTHPGEPAEWSVAKFWRHDAGTAPSPSGASG